MRIIYRAEWGATGGTGGFQSDSPALVVVHHFGSPHVDADARMEDEVRTMRGVERHHIEVNGWAGIGYNWIVMPSGRIYEGRGWLRIGAHARGQNASSCGMALAMDGTAHEPTEAALQALRELIALGVEVGAITAEHEIVGHRDVGQTECPGDRLYARLPDLTHPATVTESDPAPDITWTVERPELIEPRFPPADVRAPELPAAARAPAQPITPAVLRRELAAEGFDADQIDRIARVMERVHAAAEGAVRWWDRAGPLIRDLVSVWRGVRSP